MMQTPAPNGGAGTLAGALEPTRQPNGSPGAGRWTVALAALLLAFAPGWPIMDVSSSALEDACVGTTALVYDQIYGTHFWGDCIPSEGQNCRYIGPQPIVCAYASASIVFDGLAGPTWNCTAYTTPPPPPIAAQSCWTAEGSGSGWALLAGTVVTTGKDFTGQWLETDDCNMPSGGTGCSTSVGPKGIRDAPNLLQKCVDVTTVATDGLGNSKPVPDVRCATQ